jgi:hypothetical protein
MASKDDGTTIAERGSRRQTKAAALRVVHERFSHIQPVWVERHLGVLIALRRQFGADIDKAIILGLIGQRMMRIHPEPTVSYDAVLAGPVASLHGRFTNIESIAAASGIPRETVRRKIAELKAMGWISRAAGGDIELTGLAAQELDGISQLSIELLASVFEVIDHEIQRPDASST